MVKDSTGEPILSNREDGFFSFSDRNAVYDTEIVISVERLYGRRGDIDGRHSNMLQFRTVCEPIRM